MKTTISSEDSLQLTLQTRSPRSRFGRYVVGCLAATACLAATVSPVAAGEIAAPLPAAPPVAEEEWQFGLEIYGWAAGIDATLSNGMEMEVPFDEILEHLDMTAMVSFGARKGRWSFGSDLVYLAIEDDIYRPLGRGSIRADVKLKSWIINPVAGYTVLEGDWGHLDVMGGARYLYMKEQIGLTTVTGRATRNAYTTSSGDSWAGIVGIRGRIELPGNWYMPYYLDVGAGEPDLTWQAYVGVGYQFQSFDLIVGYRYLDWDLGSGVPISDLNIKGPMLGVRVEF